MVTVVKTHPDAVGCLDIFELIWGKVVSPISMACKSALREGNVHNLAELIQTSPMIVNII